MKKTIITTKAFTVLLISLIIASCERDHESGMDQEMQQERIDAFIEKYHLDTVNVPDIPLLEFETIKEAEEFFDEFEKTQKKIKPVLLDSVTVNSQINGRTTDACYFPAPQRTFNYEVSGLSTCQIYLGGEVKVCCGNGKILDILNITSVMNGIAPGLLTYKQLHPIRETGGANFWKYGAVGQFMFGADVKALGLTVGLTWVEEFSTAASNPNYRAGEPCNDDNNDDDTSSSGSGSGGSGNGGSGGGGPNTGPDTNPNGGSPAPDPNTDPGGCVGCNPGNDNGDDDGGVEEEQPNNPAPIA